MATLNAVDALAQAFSHVDDRHRVERHRLQCHLASNTVLTLHGALDRVSEP